MRIVNEHRIVSRECTDADVARIACDAEAMGPLFGPNTIALAHSQAEDKDPLRFFVMPEAGFGMPFVVINPRILRKSGYTVDSREGCATFPGRAYIVKQRCRIVTVQFQSIIEGKLSAPAEERLTGLPAYMFQHELDHLDAKYCYDK